MTVDAGPHITRPSKDAVSQVVTDVSDVIRGYETMLARAEDDLKPFIERLHAMHCAHLEKLTPHLRLMGGETDDAGSAMGLLHSAIATVRDWAGALDNSALPQIVDGEQMIADSYGEAIKTSQVGTELNHELEDQRAALMAQIAALKS